MRIGVAFVDAGGGRVHADEVALSLLGGERDVAAKLSLLRARLPEAASRPAVSGWAHLPASSGVSPRDLRCKVESADGGLLVSLVDVSEFDALLSYLQQAAQWRAFGSLLPTLAHAARAPLNAMVINLEVLRELLKPEAPNDARSEEQRQRSLAAIGRAVTQMRDALDHLLANAVQRAEEPVRFGLADLLREIAALVQSEATVRRVALTAELGEGAVCVEGVRADLRHAILNLALNGLEAAPEGGRMAIGLECNGDHAVVSVVDSGTGIPPEFLPEVGTMHFGTKETGNEIGLFVARTIAEAHGGSVRIDSKMGSGTRVELVLPALKEGR